MVGKSDRQKEMRAACVVGQAFSLREASAPLPTAPVENGAQTESLPYPAPVNFTSTGGPAGHPASLVCHGIRPPAERIRGVRRHSAHGAEANVIRVSFEPSWRESDTITDGRPRSFRLRLKALIQHVGGAH